MRLHPPSLALTAALLWGAAILAVGVLDITSGYGHSFLRGVASIYPGFVANGSLMDLAWGTICALIDGLIGGLLFAWLYNLFLPKG